jgi:hypothetical protein
MGSGKTYATCSIARVLNFWGNDQVVHVIDTEDAWAANLEEFPEFEFQENEYRIWGHGRPMSVYRAENVTIKVYLCLKYQEVLDATDLIAEDMRGRGVVGLEDWVIVDRISIVWPQAAPHWVRTVLKKDPDEMQRVFASAGKTGDPFFEYYRSGINPFYAEWENRVLYELGGHVVFSAIEKKLNKEDNKFKDKNYIRQMMDKAGIKPGGNSGTPGLVHSVIRFWHAKSVPFNEWRMLTCKERGGRAWFGKDRQLEAGVSFGDGYLLDSAFGGWQIV